MADDTKVVKLRQPQTAAASDVDDVISPKSLLNMTEVEQNAFLDQLRERRLNAARMMKAANEARRHATTVASAVRLEKKAEQVLRQYERASNALDKLEESLFSLRALTLQHTDIDINDATKVE